MVLADSVSFHGLSLKLNGLYDCPKEKGADGVTTSLQGRNEGRQTQSGSIAYRLHFPWMISYLILFLDFSIFCHAIFPKSSLWQNVKGSSEMELQINKFVEYWKKKKLLEKKKTSVLVIWMVL